MSQHAHTFLAAINVPAMLLLEILIHVIAIFAALDLTLRFVVHTLEFKARNRHGKKESGPLIVLLDNRVFTCRRRHGANDND